MMWIKDFFRKIFNKEQFKIFFIILGTMYSIGYLYTLFLSDTFNYAQKFIISDQQVINNIGNIKFSIPAFGGKWASRQSGYSGEAFYDILVLGDKEGGKVSIRMVTENEVWVITDAVLITNKNKIILLKK